MWSLGNKLLKTTFTKLANFYLVKPKTVFSDT